MTSLDHWHTKLAAWTHDPAEKALILLRTPEGHEGGTVRALRHRIFPEGIPSAMTGWVKQADHWASAADRPQFPQPDGQRYAPWTQVRFDQHPELVHPLSGERYVLEKLDEAAAYFKAVSFDHFAQLLDADGDARRSALSVWRFGPETPAPGLDKLWQLLPADTRVPDHTIWSHLDLTSALATAMCLDAQDTPALLTVSFGPVQEFIAQARSTSDLWAGSHLLSRIAWEGLQVICERLGPDAVIYPQLRGVAQVDLWLQHAMGLPASRFAQMDWRQHSTDANPLFAAALPNRFVALVPADHTADLAAAITQRVRDWVRNTGETMLGDALRTARLPDIDRTLPCWTQLAEQLEGFPEVHWAAVPWSLVGQQDRAIDTRELAAAQAGFLPADSGFLASSAWKLLQGELRVEGQRFYRPNPGTLYPALYELLERSVAVAKTARQFSPTQQRGYRDSLSGEAEWLTTDRAQLAQSPGQRTDTLWTRLEGRYGIRKGEHLSALGMLKRLWPTRFRDELDDAGLSVDRYVVSTHTLALATSLEHWLAQTDRPEIPIELAAKLETQPRAVLPRKLAQALYREDPQVGHLAPRLPSYLDFLRENGLEEELNTTEQQLKKLFGHKPEAYYGLILMDGDRMGAWLSGSGEYGERYRLPYRDTWHRRVHQQLSRYDNGDLHAYLNEKRAVSPARHMAISTALNGFALQLARHIVEDLCKGKLLYAGGDDLLAMVSVDDLLPAMLLLRLAYSGIDPSMPSGQSLWDWLGIPAPGLRLGKGHAVYRDRLYRLMGAQATASVGAVVAHHTAPLAGVLRELRGTEQRAKQEGGRDAFAISLLKRSGGAMRLTAPWWLERALPTTPIGRLFELRNALSANTELSRRVAYITQTWLPQLPPESAVDDYRALLAANLRYQFDRQGQQGAIGDQLAGLACDLAAWHQHRQHPYSAPEWLRDSLGVAEFLARESRQGTRHS